MESATIFISKIPAEVAEAEVVELFLSVPNSDVTGANFFRKKLYAKNSHYYFGYVSYTSPVSGVIAADMYDGLEMRYGKQISVSIKAPKVRIFVGGVPKQLTRDQLWEKFRELTPHLKRLVVYNNPIKPEENRGNVFLEYDSPEDAWAGMFELCNREPIFGTDVGIILDWADPAIEPNDEELNIVSTLHVRNIMKSVGEGDLYYVFAQIGPLQKVKKIQDFAFVHYVRRSDAKRAKRELDGIALGGAEIEVLWSKPPSPGITFRNGPPQELLESSQQSGPAYDFNAAERQELLESSQQSGSAYDFNAAECQELEDPFQSSSPPTPSHGQYLTEGTLSPAPAVRMILSVPLPQRMYTMPLPPCDCEQCKKDEELDGDVTEELETSSIVGGGHSDPDHSETESDDAAPQPEQYTETEETY